MEKETDVISMFEKTMDVQYIKYLVSKQIFCKYAGDVLDYRTAIVIEVYEGDKLSNAQVVSPKFKDKLDVLVKVFQMKGLKVKLLTINKKIK